MTAADLLDISTEAIPDCLCHELSEEAAAEQTN
jgi:hypothetical protein